MKKKFNIAPKPAMLRGEQNQRWTCSGALAELADNSFGPGRGDAKSIFITYDTKLKILNFIDNGRGMDAIGRLFQLGNTVGRAIGDIGEYGSGGTKAILWLASKVQIWSLRDKLVQYDSVTWKDWFPAESFENLGVSDDWHRATLANTPLDLMELGHGTMIKLHLLPTRKLNPSHVIRDISKIFSTGLRRGKIITWTTFRDAEVTEDTRRLTDPFIQPSNAEAVSFNIVLEYQDRHLPVSGRVFYDENTPQSESKIHLGFGFRIIRSHTECFVSRDGNERYVGTGVSGWLDLGEGWQPYLSTTKDAIDDAVLFEELMAYVFEQIKPLLKKAEYKTFDLEFEDLAIGLEHALNGRESDLTIKVEVDGGAGPPHDQIIPLPEPGPPPAEWPIPEGLGDNPGEKEKKAPPVFRLLLVPTTDIQMGTMLCRAEITGDNVIILINRDHETIKQAMKARPINRMALNLLVVSELSEAIIALNDSERFIKRIFRPTVAAVILDLDERRDRARKIARLLVDRVRNPIIAEAA